MCPPPLKNIIFEIISVGPNSMVKILDKSRQLGILKEEHVFSITVQNYILGLLLLKTLMSMIGP